MLRQVLIAVLSSRCFTTERGGLVHHEKFCDLGDVLRRGENWFGKENEESGNSRVVTWLLFLSFLTIEESIE